MEFVSYLVLCLMYVLIIVTVVGNGMVIIIILIDKRLKTVGNYLILSLAVTDLGCGLIYMPVQAIIQPKTYGNWPFSGFACELYYCLSLTMFAASNFHLVMIALDRYWSVTRVEYIFKRTPKRIGIMIIVCWTLALMISLIVIFFKVDSFESSIAKMQCFIHFKRYPWVAAITFWFYAPGLVIGFIYILIFKVAKERLQKRYLKSENKSRNDRQKSVVLTAGNINDPDLSGNQREEETRKTKETREERERRVAYTLTIVTAGYFVCWTPWCLTNTVISLCTSCAKSPVMQTLFLVTTVLATFNSALNPIIYTIFTIEFKENFKLMFLTLFKTVFCTKRTANPGNHELNRFTNSSRNITTSTQ